MVSPSQVENSLTAQPPQLTPALLAQGLDSRAKLENWDFELL